MTARRKTSPGWTVEPYAIDRCDGAILRHGDSAAGCYVVLAGSRDHGTLAMLAALPPGATLTTTELLDAAPEPCTTSCEGYLFSVLRPLRDAGLVRREKAARWYLSPAGRAMAQQLGGYDAAIERRAQAQGHHEELQRGTPCRPRAAMGTGDLRPVTLRPGSEDAARLPSRVGAMRYWRDGRVEWVG